jgi:hypothetical protein
MEQLGDAAEHGPVLDVVGQPLGATVGQHPAADGLDLLGGHPAAALVRARDASNATLARCAL